MKMRLSKIAGGRHCWVAALTAGMIFAGAALPANAIGSYTATPLGTLGGSNIYALGWGINSTGQVVGASYASPTSPHAFLFSGGSMQNLIPGAASSVAYGISDNGQVTGTQGHAFLYSGGAVQDLGTLPSGLSATGTSVNVSGQVTGYSSTSPTFPMPTHAFPYSGGVMQDLGTLGGGKSMGYGINASGQVTGSSFITGSPVEHAFVYSAD